MKYKIKDNDILHRLYTNYEIDKQNTGKKLNIFYKN